MNRLELLMLLLALFIGAVFFLRSKTFDNFVSKVLRGTQSETASELKADIEKSEKKKLEIKRNLESEEKRIQSERDALNKL